MTQPLRLKKFGDLEVRTTFADADDLTEHVRNLHEFFDRVNETGDLDVTAEPDQPEPTRCPFTLVCEVPAPFEDAFLHEDGVSLDFGPPIEFEFNQWDPATTREDLEKYPTALNEQHPSLHFSIQER